MSAKRSYYEEEPVPEPQTTPKEHDKPVFQPVTPGTPTPEDPRQREPMHDPPVDPAHDIGEDVPVRQAGDDTTEPGTGTPRPSDNVLFDENRTPG